MNEIGGVGPFEAFWRYRRFTLPASALAGLIGLLLVLASPSDVTSTVSIYLTDPRGSSVFRSGSSGPADLERYATQRAEFAESTAVLDRALEVLGSSQSAEELRDEVATGTTSSNDLRVECTARNESRAVAVCAAVSEAYVELSRAGVVAQAEAARATLEAQRELVLSRPETEATANALAEIDGRLADLALTTSLFDAGVEFTEGPRIVKQSRLGGVLQYGVAGFLFGAVAATAVAWMLADRRPLVGRAEVAAELLGVPLLGEVAIDDTRRLDPLGAVDDHYQMVALGMKGLGMGGLVAIVPADRDATTGLASALVAVAAARQGRRVMLIDGNLRERSLSEISGATASQPGFSDALSGSLTMREVSHAIPVGSNTSFEFVSSGSALEDPAGLFGSPRLADIAHNLKRSHDLVVIDVPHLLAYSDGAAVLNNADGVVLFARSGCDPRELMALRRRLDVLGTSLRGVVFQYDRG